MKYTTACILAAGRGHRLGLDRPKGFLTLGELPIVEESILKLLDCGIERVVIVTGYGAEHYHDMATRYGDAIHCVNNNHYADSGSFYSLWCARDALKEPYLLLESDLIYESRALTFCQNSSAADLVLVSDFTQAGDEVFVEVQDGALRNLSKKRELLGPEILGEFVGICKISRQLHQGLVAHMGASSTLRLDYETHGLVQAGRQQDILCGLVPDLAWAEIDDQGHLDRARRLVYPRLQTLSSPSFD